MPKLKYLLFCLLLPWGNPVAEDLRPLDHGLRYVGHDGLTPVKVEITLRERAEGGFDYVQWVMPRSWASWFGRSIRSHSALAWRDQSLWPVTFDTGLGPTGPPAGLAPGALDELAVRLRVRADIARGLRHADYVVWRADGRQETWTLTVKDAETVQTPDGTYTCFRFRLGTEDEWLEGWSAPLLVFHFVKLEHWREGRKVGSLSLDEKQL